MFLSDEGPTLETLDFTIRIGSTATFLYFDLKHERCVQNMKDACKIREMRVKHEAIAECFVAS